MVARSRGGPAGPDPLQLKDIAAVGETRTVRRDAPGGRVLAGGGCCRGVGEG